MSKLNGWISGTVMLSIGVIILPLALYADAQWSGWAPNGFTGAPGEGTCQQCHQFGPDDGQLQIIGTPAEYSPNQSYSLTVSLEDPGQQRWGFELTAVDSDGNGVGSFTVTDPVNTQLSDNNPSTARDYLKHTSTGTYNGTFDGPVTWDFQWTAPSSNRGPVTFYAAGNAADGDGTTAGNYIYATSAGVPAATVCGDVDCSGGVDIDDVVYLIAYIFTGGTAPCSGCE